MRMSDRTKDYKTSWFSKGAFLRKNSAAKSAAVLRENANIRDVHDSAWGDPAGVNRLTDEWVCEEWRSCCEPELKRKTGLGEAARQSETASSPTEVTSRGDGSRADGSTQKKGERKREGEDVPKMKEAFFFHGKTGKTSAGAMWVIASWNSLAACHRKHAVWWGTALACVYVCERLTISGCE